MRQLPAASGALKAGTLGMGHAKLSWGACGGPIALRAISGSHRNANRRVRGGAGRGPGGSASQVLQLRPRGSLQLQSDDLTVSPTSIMCRSTWRCRRRWAPRCGPAS